MPLSYSVVVSDTFPRQHARTQRFTLGEPRNVTVSPDGRRVVFLRSSSGDGSGQRPVGPRRRDRHRAPRRRPPRTARRRRRGRRCRRRRRPAANALARAAAASRRTPPTRPTPSSAFALGGRLFVGGLLSGMVTGDRRAGPGLRPTPRPARPPSGVRQRRGAAHRRTRRIVTHPRRRRDEPATVTWGSADFIAAEEMGRFRGLLVESRRHDDRGLPRRRRRGERMGDRRSSPPRATGERQSLPGRGHRQSRVSRCTSSASTGRGRRSTGTTTSFPYIASVSWTDAGLIMLVQARDQQQLDGARRRHGRRPDTWRDDGALARRRRRLGRTGAGDARADRRRTTW